MVLLGLTHTDDFSDTFHLGSKLLRLRLWPDEKEKPWDKSVLDNDFEVLVVSQFTLYHVLKGNKPDFHNAMEHEKARELYEEFIAFLRD